MFQLSQLFSTVDIEEKIKILFTIHRVKNYWDCWNTGARQATPD